MQKTDKMFFDHYRKRRSWQYLIVVQLIFRKMKDTKWFVSSFDRPNLKYEIIENKEQNFDEIIMMKY